MCSGTAELQDSRVIFMAKYCLVGFDQKHCDGYAGLEKVQDTSLKFCTDMIITPVLLLYSGYFTVSQNVIRCEHACTQHKWILPVSV